MIETFKTMKGVNNVKKEEWFEMMEEGAKSTRLNTKIENGNEEKKNYVVCKRRANLDMRKNFFTLRITDEWNALPENIKNSKNVNASKTSMIDGAKAKTGNQTTNTYKNHNEKKT